MRDRDHPIAFSPKESDRRERAELVGSIEEGAILTAPIDDIPNAASERSRGAAESVHQRPQHDLRSRIPSPCELQPDARAQCP